MNTSGYNLLPPCGLLDYFDILKVYDSSSEIIIYLEEKNNINESSTLAKYESKGSYPASVVNDIPIRNKRLLLNFRRRYIDKESGEYFHRDFYITTESARTTKYFASFFKGFHK